MNEFSVTVGDIGSVLRWIREGRMRMMQPQKTYSTTTIKTVRMLSQIARGSAPPLWIFTNDGKDYVFDGIARAQLLGAFLPPSRRAQLNVPEWFDLLFMGGLTGATGRTVYLGREADWGKIVLPLAAIDDDDWYGLWQKRVNEAAYSLGQRLTESILKDAAIARRIILNHPVVIVRAPIGADLPSLRNELNEPMSVWS